MLLTAAQKYYQAHRAERLAYAKQYRETHKNELAIKRKKYYDTHREKIKTRNRIYRETHLEQRRAYSREYARAHPRRARNYQLWYCHGMTQTDYRGLRKKQDGRCAICNKRQWKLQVDHNHKTGVIRGLLCNHCNTLLGFAKDNIIVLEAAINYLKD